MKETIKRDEDIDKIINDFNSKYSGKIVNVCSIMRSLYLDEIDIYTFCCVGAKSIPEIGPVNDFMPKFTKEYYLKKYMKCFEELQSSACDICSNCVYLHKERFTPIIYQDFRLKNIGLGLFEKCNIHCVYCGEAPQNYSNVIDMRKVLNQLISEDLVGPETQLILANGEPTIHKYFEDLLTRAFKMNMRIQVRTNGVVFNNLLYQYLKSDKVSINISIDSGTRETYLKIKRAERFDVVWENRLA